MQQLLYLVQMGSGSSLEHNIHHLSALCSSTSHTPRFLAPLQTNSHHFIPHSPHLLPPKATHHTPDSPPPHSLHATPHTCVCGARR